MRYFIKVLLGLGFFVFSLFHSIIAFSNDIFIGSRKYNSTLFNSNLLIKTAVDYDKKIFYINCGDSLIKIDLKTFSEIERVKLKLPKESDFLLEASIPVFYLNELHIVHIQGGYLYKVVSDSLCRVDRSFNHKMQCESSIFVLNDTLYKFGGYGFWSCRNFSTFFNSSSKEWDIVQPLTSLVPQGVSFADTYFDKNNMYVFNGFYQEDGEYQKSKDFDQYWSFNFVNKQWRYLGMRQISYSKYQLKITGKNYFIQIDDKYSYKLDILNNKAYVYSKSALATSIIANSFYYDGYLYLIVANSKENSPVYLRKVKEDQLLKDLVEIKEIYRPKNRIYYVLSVIFVIPLLGFGFWVFDKKRKLRKRIILKNGEIQFQNAIQQIDKNSYNIIKALLEKNDLDTNSLLELIDNQDLHYSHRTRVLHQLITELNLKLSLLTGINEDFILVKKSDIDKRIKTYYLNKSMF